MADPGMNDLLKWGIENAEATRTTQPQHPPTDRRIDAEALSALLGGPSDADLMKEAMHVVRNPEALLEDRITAFDNFEQMVENLDNANNMETLGLWTPLLEMLDSKDADMRRMAAWCVGTAVQNNARSQERLLAMDGIPKLVKMAVHDENQAASRKAVYALSSSIRNYQPSTDEAVKFLPQDVVGVDKVAADDMTKIDSIMETLRK